MKKLILSVAAIFAFGFASAQDTKFGLKGGLNLANFTDAETNTKVGVNFGAFAEVKINSSFAIQPELLFSMQGAKSGDTSINLNYLNIPVMAKVTVGEGFSLQAGPQLGVLLTATGSNGGVDVDLKSSLKTIDFGLNLGAGYDVNENIMIDARYNFGMGGLAKDLAAGVTDSNHRIISISLGYKF